MNEQKRLAIHNLLASTTRADQIHTIVEMWQEKVEKVDRLHNLVIFSFRWKSIRAVHVKDLKLIAPTLRVLLGGKIAFEVRPLPTK